MRSLLGSLFVLAMTQFSAAQDYYSFPDTGWSQTLLFSIHNGQSWNQYVEGYQYNGDTIIEGKTYNVILNNRGQDYFLRFDHGKIYWFFYAEGIIYDFTLEEGDTLKSLYAQGLLNAVVVNKERIRSTTGDSLWFMELRRPNAGDTIRWLEGVGRLHVGILPNSFPDAGYQHICTLNKKNQTLFESQDLPLDCNCDYIHGADHDDDGFRNHNPLWTYIEISPFHPQNFVRNEKHRICDTLIIYNGTGLSVSVVDSASGYEILPDSIEGAQEVLFFYNFGNSTSILITHQFSEIYYEVQIMDCETNDCNDENPEIHPGAEDIPDNNIDEDCDGNDLMTSSHDVSESSIKVYPNPVSETLFVYSEHHEILSCSLYEVSGARIMQVDDNMIDVSNLPHGIYFLQIHGSQSCQRSFEKIIVTR